MTKAAFLLAVLMMVSWGQWKGQTLTETEIVRRWGKQKFTISSFVDGSLEQRAAMAADLTKNPKLFVGKNALEIKALLGPFSGHYFNESYPTYLIQRGTDAKPESWQLVFLIDRHSKVKDIIVHKNCCY